MFWIRDEHGCLVNLEECYQIRVVELPKQCLKEGNVAGVAVVAYSAVGGVGALSDGRPAVADHGHVLFSSQCVGSEYLDHSLRMCHAYLTALETMLVQLRMGIVSSVLSQAAINAVYVDLHAAYVENP